MLYTILALPIPRLHGIKIYDVLVVISGKKIRQKKCSTPISVTLLNNSNILTVALYFMYM